MSSRGCCACDRYDNTSIIRGVRVLCRRKDGCEAETRGVGGVQKWKKSAYRFPTSIYFATSMPSRGCCAGGGYYNQSMVRKEVGWECSGEEWMDVRQRSKSGGGCLEVEKENVQIFYLNILCYKYDISWLLCM